MNPTNTRIVGLGSALVDILAHETDTWVDRIGYPKGGMTLADLPELEATLAQLSATPVQVPGGSACNTAVGVARLGGKARFVGKRGDDPAGHFFEHALVERGVEPVLLTSGLPTGSVLSIITPDAQRTMITHLGASADTRPHEIKADYFKDSALVHVEGYMLFNPDLMRASLAAAKQAGARISLDLASFTVVEQSRDILEQIIADNVDILIANEDEALAYTGIEDEIGSLNRLARHVDIAVLKVGARGSFIQQAGRVYRVAATGTHPAVDTTGAGDLWASGFLYGLVHGYDHQMSGRLASACGYEVCQVVGADIPSEGWSRIKKRLEA